MSEAERDWKLSLLKLWMYGYGDEFFENLSDAEVERLYREQVEKDEE